MQQKIILFLNQYRTVFIFVFCYSEEILLKLGGGGSLLGELWYCVLQKLPIKWLEAHYETCFIICLRILEEYF